MAGRTHWKTTAPLRVSSNDPPRSDPLAGVQILASLDSKWTPRDLFHDVEARKHFRKSMFCWGMFWWTW